MKQKLEFDIYENIEVKNETLSGVLINFRPYKLDPASPGVAPDILCDLANYDEISIDLVIKRESGSEVIIYEGYLESLLVALYGQTTRFEMAKKKTSVGYLVNLDLSPFAIQLTGKDVLLVKMKADRVAFTSTNKSISSITLETIRAIAPTPFVPVVRHQNIGNGDDQIDMELGDNVLKVIAATDFTAAYDASVKAKVVSGTLKARGNFEKVFTETLLYADNMAYFDNNPESDIQDLVLFWDKTPLNDVKLRAQLSLNADKDAKVLTVHRVSAY